MSAWARTDLSASAARFGSTLRRVVYNSPRARRLARTSVVQRAHRSRFVQHVECLMSKCDPTKFVILGRQRTGSNLLRFELDRRCPLVAVRGEEFTPELRRDGESVEELAGRVFRSSDRELVVGCKVFYEHLTVAELKELLALDGLKVVHLRRRNWLRRFVSAEIASRHDWWIQDRPGPPPEARDRAVVVDLDRLFLDFRMTVAQQAMVTRCLQGSDVLDVWYEELDDQLDPTLDQVARFLGAPRPMPSAEPGLRRQNPEPLRLLVRNYGEVRRALVGTRWQRFLDPSDDGA